MAWSLVIKIYQLCQGGIEWGKPVFFPIELWQLSQRREQTQLIQIFRGVPIHCGTLFEYIYKRSDNILKQIVKTKHKEDRIEESTLEDASINLMYFKGLIMTFKSFLEDAW